MRLRRHPIHRARALLSAKFTCCCCYHYAGKPAREEKTTRALPVRRGAAALLAAAAPDFRPASAQPSPSCDPPDLGVVLVIAVPSGLDQAAHSWCPSSRHAAPRHGSRSHGRARAGSGVGHRWPTAPASQCRRRWAPAAAGCRLCRPLAHHPARLPVAQHPAPHAAGRAVRHVWASRSICECATASPPCCPLATGANNRPPTARLLPSPAGAAVFEPKYLAMFRDMLAEGNGGAGGRFVHVLSPQAAPPALLENACGGLPRIGCCAEVEAIQVGRGRARACMLNTQCQLRAGL